MTEEVMRETQILEEEVEQQDEGQKADKIRDGFQM